MSTHLSTEIINSEINDIFNNNQILKGGSPIDMVCAFLSGVLFPQMLA